MDKMTTDKIGEVAIIPIGKACKIHGKDSNGVFVKGREVSPTAFQMSRHLVTQDLFEAVMGYRPGSGNSSISEQVGLKKTTNFGVYDMSSNVYEWCWDRLGSISTGAETNQASSASGTKRVRRGGNWLNYARGCIVTYRNCGFHDVVYGNIGFLIVRSTI